MNLSSLYRYTKIHFLQRTLGVNILFYICQMVWPKKKKKVLITCLWFVSERTFHKHINCLLCLLPNSLWSYWSFVNCFLYVSISTILSYKCYFPIYCYWCFMIFFLFYTINIFVCVQSHFSLGFWCLASCLGRHSPCTALYKYWPLYIFLAFFRSCFVLRKRSWYFDSIRAFSRWWKYFPFVLSRVVATSHK